MKHEELKVENIESGNAIYLCTHAPFVMTGKYSDSQDGVITTANIDEYKFETLCARCGDVEIYINGGEKNTFDVDEITFDAQKDPGSLKAIIYGIFATFKQQGVIPGGITFSCKTNIQSLEGFQTHFAFQILKALSILYRLNLSNLKIAHLVQDIMENYFGRIIPLTYIVALYQDGVTLLTLKGDDIKVEKQEEMLDKYELVNLVDGRPLNGIEHNTFLKSLYDVYTNYKNALEVDSVLDVDVAHRFDAIFGPHSELKDMEKLIITHLVEENKRAKDILTSYTEKEYTQRIYNALNMSLVEIGSYIGLNKFNNFLEANIIKNSTKVPCTMAQLNIEATNNFVFVCEKEHTQELIGYLKTYKNYFVEQIRLTDKGLVIEKY